MAISTFWLKQNLLYYFIEFMEELEVTRKAKFYGSNRKLSSIVISWRNLVITIINYNKTSNIVKHLINEEGMTRIHFMYFFTAYLLSIQYQILYLSGS